MTSPLPRAKQTQHAPCHPQTNLISPPPPKKNRPLGPSVFPGEIPPAEARVRGHGLVCEIQGGLPWAFEGRVGF